ncbi:MAG: nucleotide exchange factor GrpE [Bacteroidales bacterium]|nr:nucleotide exchange factor GrpE [Bacteroidales bacterium]
MSKKENKNTKPQEEMVDDVTFENKEEQPTEEKEVQEKGKKSGKKAPADKKRIEELEQNLADLNDKYLRLYSEFDNFRKRTNKERLELQLSASKDTILQILPVVDDFERAIQSFEAHNLSQEAREGVQLIYNKLMNILKQKGLEAMDVKNQEFNTDQMEAITNIPAPSEEMKGKVVDVIEQGYLLHGKILRFAKVVVGQ